MKKSAPTPKRRPFLFLIQLLAIVTTFFALFLFYQTQILPPRIFVLFTIFYLLLLALFIILSRRFLLLIILLFLQILLNLVAIFLSLKYNDYFAQIGQHDNYTEKYSLITLADSEFAKNPTGSPSKIGLLQSDPYQEYVRQFLTNEKNPKTGLLAQNINQQDLLQFDNLLSLTSAIIHQASLPAPDQKVKTIFLGRPYLDSLKENNQEVFAKLYVLQEVDLSVSPKTIETTKNSSLDTAFAVYLSGIDNRDHTMPYAARSDVNLIMVVNPDKRKILILNTPRDFYVPLAMNGQKDKLTHAGLYGVNESIRTLENFYQIKINYYARINFDAFASIIDQIGGVDVTIPYTVNTYHGGRHYAPGSYHLNGDEALDFAR